MRVGPLKAVLAPTSYLYNYDVIKFVIGLLGHAVSFPFLESLIHWIIQFLKVGKAMDFLAKSSTWIIKARRMNPGQTPEVSLMLMLIVLVNLLHLFLPTHHSASCTVCLHCGFPIWAHCLPIYLYSISVKLFGTTDLMGQHGYQLQACTHSPHCCVSITTILRFIFMHLSTQLDLRS